MACFLLCGVPGTGKSSIARELGAKGYAAVDLSALVKEKKLYIEFDVRDGAFVADLKALEAECKRIGREAWGKKVLFEGHLGVEIKLPAARVCVCRCNPRELETRLAGRGYAKDKIKQNVSAEMLDYQTALAEKKYGAKKVFEIDTTGIGVGESAKEAEEVFVGRGGALAKFRPRVDWSGILFEDEVKFR